MEIVKGNFPLWFFQLYFLTKIVYYCIARIKKSNILIYLICMITIIIMTVPFQEVVMGRPAYHINVLPVAIIFMTIGQLFFEMNKNEKIIIKIKDDFIKEVIAYICIFIGLIVAYRYPGNVAHIGSLIYIVGACFTVFGFYIFAEYDKGVILAFLGENSVIILGLHGLIGGLFRNFIEGNLMNNWDGPLMNFVLVSLQLSLLSMIILCYRLLKYLLYRVLYTKVR